MTLLNSLNFSSRQPQPKVRLIIYLGQKLSTLSSFSLHTPSLSNQAEPMKWRGGGAANTTEQQQQPEEGGEAASQNKGTEGSISSASSLPQTVSRQEGAAHLNIHTFLHLKTSLLYFKGKIKDPPNPFQKNPIIIITIIKNPIRNHKEALRVWVVHSSSMLFGLFVFLNWWLYTY